MKPKPIIFSGPMVRAILDDRKTQTRRKVKPQPSESFWPSKCEAYEPRIVDRNGEQIPGKPIFGCYDRGGEDVGYKAPYRPGDTLYVKEAHWVPPPITPKMLLDGADTWPEAIYAADTNGDWEREHGWRKRPSIHLPQCWSRISLLVKDVRIQRVQEIKESEYDCEAEGAFHFPYCVQDTELGGTCSCSHRAYWEPFMELWNSIHGDDAWELNDWIWVYEFERVKP